MYIKDSIKCEEVLLGSELPMECLGVNVFLSSQMHFFILVVYNPPACDVQYYAKLEELLKYLKSKSAWLVFGDFNINWMDNPGKNRLKAVIMTTRFLSNGSWAHQK